LRALKRSGLCPRRSIELVMFTSEEPTRFGIGCLGSRLLSGTLDPVRADALQDKDGTPLSIVRIAAGFVGSLASVRLPPNHYYAWIELHIEQGPLLEREGIPIGIVTSIAAPAGYRFTITGFGGHAGALLMPDRKDALCAAAELILSVEKHTLATGAIDTVATVGTCEVHPGAVNSVPSRVILQLDIRDTDPDRREAVMQAIRRDCEELRQRRKVTITEELVNADAPAQSSPTWEMRAKTLRADTWNFVAQRLSTISLSGNRPHKNAWITEGRCSLAARGAESDSGYASGDLRQSSS